jgi:hypothetical protein
VGQKYREPPQIHGKIEDIFAKEKMMKFFVEIMPNNIKHFKIDGYHAIYEADNSDKSITFSVNP